MTQNLSAVDVAIVGAGAAGLNAALVLGRARRSVAVIDSGAPRNRFAAHMNGFLSRDGTAPGELLAIGRDEAEGYGAQFVEGSVAALSGDAETGFALALDGGRLVRARRVLVATGITDVLPPIPGLAERWGRDVLHCPYCDGYEVRDQPIGVLASSAMDAHKALMLSQWSPDVVLFLHETPLAVIAADLRARLAKAGVVIQPGPVAGVAIDDFDLNGVFVGGALTGVRLGDGSVVARSCLFISPRMVPQDALLRSAGAVTADTPVGPFVVADPLGVTSVAGLYGAGNCVDAMAQVINAASQGAKVAAAINMGLILADTA